MNLTNNEHIEIKDRNKSIYTFCGVNNETFDLVFDNTEKYFKIIRYENDLFYTLKCENSYRPPDIKKFLIAYKYRNEVDTSLLKESIQNIFHYEDLKIVNISTTFTSYYDETLKKNIYTQKPKYYTYLIEYNGFCTILSYNENKYSTKAMNIHKSDYDFY